MFQAFGDSIVAGLGASVPSKCWVQKLNPINSGVSGYQAADVSNLVLSVTPEVENKYIVAIGANDVYKYRDSVTKQAYFRQCLTAILAWLSSPVKSTATTLVRTGAWHNTSSLVNSFGLASSTNGGRLYYTVRGPKLYVGYTIQDYHLTVGTADVKVNGIKVGDFSCSGQGMTTHMGPILNTFWGAAAKVFDTGLDENEEGTVEIEITSPTNTYFYCDWIASGQQSSPKICVGNILERTEAAYNINLLTPAMTEAYNLIIADVVAGFPNAVLVDNNSAILPNSHLADGVHPNDAGHAIIAKRFRNALYL